MTTDELEMFLSLVDDRCFYYNVGFSFFPVIFKELFLLQCIQDGCISSFTSSPDTRTPGMMTCVTVAASTMIPFSSLAGEPHQH